MPPPEGQGTQLGLLCACGRRPIELKGLRCCRLCYYRQYDSLRWFGGLRELILKRDRFRCRACGSARRLVVHHRYERNAQALLITLCITCHVRLHHSRRFRSWVPEALLGLWNELHPSVPFQMQLPFATKKVTVSAAGTASTGQRQERNLNEKPKLLHSSLALAEEVGQGNRFGLADRVRDQALCVEPVQGRPIKALPGPRPIVQGQI